MTSTAAARPASLSSIPAAKIVRATSHPRPIMDPTVMPDDHARVVGGRRLAVEHDLDRALHEPRHGAGRVAEHRQVRRQEDGQGQDEEDDVEVAQGEHQRSPAACDNHVPNYGAGEHAGDAASNRARPLRRRSAATARRRRAPRIVGRLGGSVVGIALWGLRFGHGRWAARGSLNRPPLRRVRVRLEGGRGTYPPGGGAKASGSRELVTTL